MSFTTRLLHRSLLLDVHFNEVAYPGSKYFAEVNTGSDVIVSFEMQKDQYNKWKVMHPVPQWIIGYEADLAETIAVNQLPAPEQL
jgi:hypothetical protein